MYIIETCKLQGVAFKNFSVTKAALKKKSCQHHVCQVRVFNALYRSLHFCLDRSFCLGTLNLLLWSCLAHKLIEMRLERESSFEWNDNQITSALQIRCCKHYNIAESLSCALYAQQMRSYWYWCRGARLYWSWTKTSTFALIWCSVQAQKQSSWSCCSVWMLCLIYLLSFFTNKLTMLSLIHPFCKMQKMLSSYIQLCNSLICLLGGDKIIWWRT